MKKPELLTEHVISNISAIHAVFDVDAFLIDFLKHPIESLGNLMMIIIKVNWMIIPDSEKYLPILIENTFSMSAQSKAFQIRLNTLSEIIEYEISNKKSWNDSFSLFIENIEMYVHNKNAMIVFSLCCLHFGECNACSWSETLLVEVSKQLCFHISECDFYSDIFLQCLSNITNEIGDRKVAIENADTESFIYSLFEKEETRPFYTLILWRLNEFPSERITLLQKLAAYEINTELSEAPHKIKENICTTLVQIIKNCDIKEIINDPICYHVLDVLIHASQVFIDTGLCLYELIISKDCVQFLDVDDFCECCSSLIDELDENDRTRFPNEVAVIEKFISD